MTNLSTKCSEGGWTLVMKLDRNKVKHVMINIHNMYIIQSMLIIFIDMYNRTIINKIMQVI